VGVSALVVLVALFLVSKEESFLVLLISNSGNMGKIQPLLCVKLGLAMGYRALGKTVRILRNSAHDGRE
jgi:hypothetical protein